MRTRIGYAPGRPLKLYETCQRPVPFVRVSSNVRHLPRSRPWRTRRRPRPGIRWPRLRRRPENRTRPPPSRVREARIVLDAGTRTETPRAAPSAPPEPLNTRWYVRLGPTGILNENRPWRSVTAAPAGFGFAPCLRTVDVATIVCPA